MGSDHATRLWLCPVKGHGALKFSDSQAFKKHMLLYHSELFGESQLEALAQMNSKPLSKPFTSCPLCDKLADDLSGLGSMSGERKPDNLPRHISGHLKELAILAFPPAEGHTSSKKVKSSQSDVSRNCSQSYLPELPEVFRTYAPLIDTAMIYPDTQLQRWECDNCGRYRLEIGPDQICPDCQHLRCDTCTVFTEKQPPNLMAPLTSLARLHEEGGSFYDEMWFEDKNQDEARQNREDEWRFWTETHYPPYNGHFDDPNLQELINKYKQGTFYL
jgi:hypothetical protein